MGYIKVTTVHPDKIDGFGYAHVRGQIRTLMRRSGAEDRTAKAQARREHRAAKRAKQIDTTEEA